MIFYRCVRVLQLYLDFILFFLNFDLAIWKSKIIDYPKSPDLF
jgi:hypothetical protein